MQTLFRKPHVDKMIKGGNHLFTVISLVSVPLLLALPVYWYYERAPVRDIRNVAILEVVPGETTKLTTYYKISLSSNRALYRMWLQDASGKDVYDYAPITLNECSSFTFGNQSITIPTQLSPGDYSLRAELQYPLNPLKVAKISAELVHLKIRNTEENK